jgi:hypothetical protein
VALIASGSAAYAGEDTASFHDKVGVTEWLRRRPFGERIGAGADCVPFLYQQRRLDCVATEPNVVVADGALGEQSLACGERGIAR